MRSWRRFWGDPAGAAPFHLPARRERPAAPRRRVGRLGPDRLGRVSRSPSSAVRAARRRGPAGPAGDRADGSPRARRPLPGAARCGSWDVPSVVSDRPASCRGRASRLSARPVWRQTGVTRRSQDRGDKRRATPHRLARLGGSTRRFVRTANVAGAKAFTPRAHRRPPGAGTGEHGGTGGWRRAQAKSPYASSPYRPVVPSVRGMRRSAGAGRRIAGGLQARKIHNADGGRVTGRLRHDPSAASPARTARRQPGARVRWNTCCSASWR